MRKTLGFAVLGSVLVLGLSVAANVKPPADFQAAMKENGATLQKLAKDVEAKDYDAIAAGAAIFKKNFMGPVGKYFTDAKNDDGLKQCTAAFTAAEGLEKAAKAKDEMACGHRPQDSAGYVRQLSHRAPRAAGRQNLRDQNAVGQTWHNRRGAIGSPSVVNFGRALLRVDGVRPSRLAVRRVAATLAGTARRDSYCCCAPVAAGRRRIERERERRELHFFPRLLAPVHVGLRIRVGVVRRRIVVPGRRSEHRALRQFHRLLEDVLGLPVEVVLRHRQQRSRCGRQDTWRPTSQRRPRTWVCGSRLHSVMSRSMVICGVDARARRAGGQREVGVDERRRDRPPASAAPSRRPDRCVERSTAAAPFAV